MSTSTSPIFNGSSSFSSDFAQVISRAVSIASLPITQLNNQDNALTGEQTALSSLSTSFTSLQSSIAAMSTAAASGNYSLSYSDSTVASATATSGATAGSYTLEVDDPGSNSTAVSAATVADPTTDNISASTSYTLTANGQQYTIEPPPNANTLTSLVSAINTTTQGAVQATIINIGTTSQPQYELSLKSTAYSTDDISLDDGTGNILNDTTEGSPVQYRINGQPDSSQDPLTSDTRALILSPGLSATVLAEGATTITVSQTTSSIASAISSFVRAYNATSTAVQGQRGVGGGALSGQSVVNVLAQSLQHLANYTGTGSVQSIADLGLTFDKFGVMSFDPSVLSSAASSDFQSVTDFLGSATGGGFLQAATNTLNQVLDSTSGTIPTETNAVAGQILSTNNQINADQDRVNALQTSLTARMDAADAMIAQMQQQYSYLTGLFASMTSNNKTG
jgi:flagellar hook-associated protein 2